MPQHPTSNSRKKIDQLTYADEHQMIQQLVEQCALTHADHTAICAAGADLVRRIRAASKPGLMEVFLAEYGLSTDEGVALMCLAEALLRVPDPETIDALIEDKIAPSDWGRHLGHSSSSLVNASTWALMLTGRVLDDDQPGLVGTLRAAVKRLGEPLIRTAVAAAMREMGRQFVLGETIDAAIDRATDEEAKGYTYSYDMLGEAARTAADADRYFEAYVQAIETIAQAAKSTDIRENPGISVKLSALHPRYEEAQRTRVLTELTSRLVALCGHAARANIGLNIDAEEADRLSLSLDVIAASLPDIPNTWQGLGVVVQAYGQRAGAVIDWLHDVAIAESRRFLVRLVKGAYWDTEIKQAQVAGLAGFPVFTNKAATDVSYIANARKLLGMTDRIYPQFATHNAHSVAAILRMGASADTFEFQKLHGMGDQLHDLVMQDHGSRCRIYAPVGTHRDLLAYLVRRLLENGANSSFVHQIVDEDVAPETVASDPFLNLNAQRIVVPGTALYQPERRNSAGFDLAHRPTLAKVDEARGAFRKSEFAAGATLLDATERAVPVAAPQSATDIVGHVVTASDADIEEALTSAQTWDASVSTRAKILNRAADLYELHYGKLFALLAREAGKTLPDAVAELREAVDFLRYYSARAQIFDRQPRGIFACISPWNFPLAIFTGQIAGVLATGNGALAKPAEQTPLIAQAAVDLMHEAGVPRSVLQLLPGDGRIGATLTSDPRVKGVVFTGSTATALKIRQTMADHLDPGAPLIAETGGLNAMIVDSTALPEQAVRDILQSAFQSAGQRCSALRCLYVQEDIAEEFKEMLFGAMDQLYLGDPWDLSTDVGPIIDATARDNIADYVADARAKGNVLHQTTVPERGYFIAPTVIAVDGIAQMDREIFGPVLHLCTFKADDINQVCDDIAATGYGLTFSLHTRIDDRVQHIVERLPVGNIYVNRNQIGAIVGSQPFGGEGLSGTGPKAGGPDYLARFAGAAQIEFSTSLREVVEPNQVQAALDAVVVDCGPQSAVDLPGPTGESNRLTRHPKAPLLCLGPGPEALARQVQAVEGFGGAAIPVPGALDPGTLGNINGSSAAIWWGDRNTARAYARALAGRKGPILPLITGDILAPDVLGERHLCVDTTAAGGNAELLAQVSKDL